MSQERLDHLMLLYCEKDNVGKIYIKTVVDRWTTLRYQRPWIA